MLTESITWHPVAEQLPDADLTVHVATEGCEEPVWLGFLDGETWRDVDGMEITVTHWAEMLKGPTPGVGEVGVVRDLDDAIDRVFGAAGVKGTPE